jgi:hypothetical protein
LDAVGAAGFIGLDICVVGCVAAIEGFFTGGAAAGSNGFGFGVEVTPMAESFAAAGLVMVAGFNVFC